MSDRITLYTIGHSNHSLEQFGERLARHGIRMVVDVRSSPYSRYATHFGKESLEQFLRARGTGYVYLGDALGGQPQAEGYYDAEGYVRYDLLAATERFQAGLARAIQLARNHRTALLCSEEDPAECHRHLLIARVLVAQGVTVLHLRAEGPPVSDEELTRAEELSRSGGQRSLFEAEEEPRWRSTRSARPASPPPSSSDC